MASFSFYLIQAPLVRAVKGVCLRWGWEVDSWLAFGSVVIAMFVVVQTAAGCAVDTSFRCKGARGVSSAYLVGNTDLNLRAGDLWAGPTPDLGSVGHSGFPSCLTPVADHPDGPDRVSWVSKTAFRA